METESRSQLDIKRLLKRAKVFEIRKIIKQIRMLESRKGSDVQLKKSQRKVVRLRDVLEALKDINLGCVAEEIHQSLKNSHIHVHVLTHEMQASTGSCTERAKYRLLANKTFQRNINTTPSKHCVQSAPSDGGVQQETQLQDEANIWTQRSTLSDRNASGSDDEILCTRNECGGSTSADTEQEEDCEKKLSPDYSSSDDGLEDTSMEDTASLAVKSSTKKKENAKWGTKVPTGNQPKGSLVLESTFVGTLSEANDSTTMLQKQSRTNTKAMKQKMNRPGQRTRQRQWEKLFGEKAKHVQGRKKGQKLRREKKGKATNNRLKKSNTTSLSAWSYSSHQPQLHPSWEAQRKRKAKETGIPQFLGQRTVFSE